MRRLRGAGRPDAGRRLPELQAHPLLPPPLRLLVRAPAQRAGWRAPLRGVPRRTHADARRTMTDPVTPTITVEERPDPADQQTVLDGLLAFNTAIVGDPKLTPFSV